MPRFWRQCRLALRYLRFTVWALLLALLCAFAWLNLIGLPDFLKTQLTATLRSRGVELEFSRMRLRLIHGLVAENVSIGDAKNPARPRLTASEVQLQLDYNALRHQKLLLDGLVVLNGKLTIPITPTNALAVFNLQTELRFRANDTWLLDNFSADFAGAKILLTGEISHARGIQHWPFLTGKKSAAGQGYSFQQLSDTLAQIKFSRAPQINLRVTGDGRDFHSFVVRLNATAPEVQTPWFAAQGLQGAAYLTVPTNAPAANPEAWGFWTNLEPFRLAWTVRTKKVQTEKIQADSTDVIGLWEAPEMAVTKLSAQLGGGLLKAAATLNVATRLVTFTNDSSFDLHAVAAVLTPKTRLRLAEIVWFTPPHIQASGSLQLPPWTNGAADWRDDIEPTVWLTGGMAFTNAQVGGVKLDVVRTAFDYANLLWTLPDLEIIEGGTKLHVSGQESEATKNFHARLSGQFDANSVRPFLTTSNALRGFGHLTFNTPLALNLDVRGNIREIERLSATGTLALTNFAIRGQTVDWLATGVSYTNLTAEFLQPHLARAGGEQHFSAEQVTLDLAGQKLVFTNGTAFVEPMVVAWAIGPKTAKVMESYQFSEIPKTRVNGIVPLKHQDGELVNDDANLRVDITEATPFRWRKFATPRIIGTVRWWQNYVIITNATSECYGGTAQGWGNFNVKTPGDGTDFNFFITGTNVDFHRMGTALWSPTNNLEGALSGTVTVTRANSSDWRTWDGFGAAKLRDGVLWDVPVIGLVSPALNTFSPGLGNARATEAAGSFTMTNGVVFSDTLEIRSLTMLMKYVGTVDLEQRVEARVTAQLLRTMPVFGSLVSTLLWPVSKIFECRVTGTLGQPKPTPIYVPKLLLVPLHPIRSMEEIFTASPATNAPAKGK